MPFSRCSQPSGVSSSEFHLSPELLTSVRISPQSSISSARPGPRTLPCCPITPSASPCTPDWASPSPASRLHTVGTRKGSCQNLRGNRCGENPPTQTTELKLVRQADNFPRYAHRSEVLGLGSPVRGPGGRRHGFRNIAGKGAPLRPAGWPGNQNGNPN